LLKSGLAPPSVKRTSRALKAALNLVASHDPRITNAAAWRIGLASLPDAETARNVILPEDSVRAIISAAWALDPELGLLVECAAVTGARASHRGRGPAGRQVDTKTPNADQQEGARPETYWAISLPIPHSLAAKLRSNRPVEEPLLLRQGSHWRPFDHRNPFRRAVERAGLDPGTVTIYALRHSSIVRQLLGNIPIRVVAAHHDTSVVMLERTYSKYIGDHSDALTRRTIIDLAAPSGGNNVAMAGRD